MRWYEKLYVGEKAKKHRYETIQAVRNGRPMGFYVLAPAAGERNLLDIYPALTLKLPYYEKQDLLIVGIAADFEDAAALAGRIICEAYKKTGGYDPYIADDLKGHRDHPVGDPGTAAHSSSAHPVCSGPVPGGCLI